METPMAEEFNPVLMTLAMQALEKQGFVGMDPASAGGGGGGMGMDPAAMGMDPSMMGGGMDPAMMGGMPPGGDPAAAGMDAMQGDPTAMAGTAPPDPIAMLDQRLASIEGAIASLAQMMQMQQQTAAGGAAAGGTGSGGEKKGKGGGNADLIAKIDQLISVMSQMAGVPDPNMAAQPQMPPAGMPPGAPMPGMGTSVPPMPGGGAPTGMEVSASLKRTNKIGNAIATLLASR